MTRPVVAGCGGAALVMSSVVDDCCLATHGPTDDINNAAPLQPATTGQAMRAQLSQGGHWVRGGWGQAGRGGPWWVREAINNPPKRANFILYVPLYRSRSPLTLKPGWAKNMPKGQVEGLRMWAGAKSLYS